jgi:hypothetical protein
MLAMSRRLAAVTALEHATRDPLEYRTIAREQRPRLASRQDVAVTEDIQTLTLRAHKRYLRLLALTIERVGALFPPKLLGLASYSPRTM